MTRTAADVWTDPDARAATLLVLAADEFGMKDLLGWLPETTRLEVEETFHVALPEPNFAKLMAAVTILTTDAFHTLVPDFIAVTNALNGDTPGEFDPPDAAEIAWALTEALLLDPDHDEPFSLDVRCYIGATLDSEGVGRPPDLLAIGIRGARAAGGAAPDPRVEDAKRDEIIEYVRRNLRLLAEQLESLPLVDGDASGIVERMRATLQTE